MNYKIKVENEAESKEAQELFFELGSSWRNSESKNPITTTLDFPLMVCVEDSNLYLSTNLYDDKKEITLPELKDMVVLKRNDMGDANYKNHYGDRFYVTNSLQIFIYQHKKWVNHCIQSDSARLEIMQKLKNTGGDISVLLKPIKETEMKTKEFLNIKADYIIQVLPEYAGDDPESGLIEVPDGAEIHYKSDTSNVEFFLKCKDSDFYFNYGKEWLLWCGFNKNSLNMFKTTWKRETLNDQVASAELARQSDKVLKEILEDEVNQPFHYNKGGIECIDAIQSSMTHDAFCGYLKGNVQKYMWRYENKGGAESLKKAQWYLNKLIEIQNANSCKD